LWYHNPVAAVGAEAVGAELVHRYRSLEYTPQAPLSDYPLDWGIRQQQAVDQLEDQQVAVEADQPVAAVL
jgi:hypothetical protein